MSDIRQSRDDFFDAIANVAGKVINTTPIDVTVSVKIVQVRNIEVGEYRVRHQGNTMTAFSIDPMTVYRVGEEVYMLVPRGDFSAKKLIIGQARLGDGTSFADRHQMMNQWIDVGPNWLSHQWYWRTNTNTHRQDARDQSICVISPAHLGSMPAIATGTLPLAERPAWRGNLFERRPAPGTELDVIGGIPRPDPSHSDAQRARTRRPPSFMVTGDLARIDRLFQGFANEMDHFQVRATFQTAFSATHSSGDYGILVECLVANPQFGLPDLPDEPEFLLAQFRLSCFNFNGNPYGLNVPTPQIGTFAVPRGALKGLVRVSVYQDDNFVTDIVPVHEQVGGQYTGALNFAVPPATRVVDRNNIHVTDVQIHFVEQINLTDGLYHIHIDSPQGLDVWDSNFSTPANPTVLLRARLFYGSRELTDVETCRFYWFREKVDATTLQIAAGTGADHDEFGRNWHDYGGDGWAPIAWPFPNTNERVGLAYTPGISAHFGQQPAGNPGRRNYVVEALNVNPPAPLSPPAPDDRVAFNELRVPIERVPWRWRYKVVCIYNGVPRNADLIPAETNARREVVVFAERTVKNPGANFDLEIPYPQLGMSLDNTFIRVRNNRLPWVEYPMFDETLAPRQQRDWWCRWWFTGPNGTRRIFAREDIDQLNQYRAGRININDFMTQDLMHFTAQVYAPVPGAAQPPAVPPEILPSVPLVPWVVPSGTAEFIEVGIVHLTVGQPDGPPFIVEFTGRSMFNYHADGTIKPESSLFELNTIRADVRWAGNGIGQYRVQWFAPDGITPLSDPGNAVHTQERVGLDPPGSMMYGVWATTAIGGRINNRNAVKFRVKEHFDGSLRSNTFIFRVTLFNDIAGERCWDFPKEIQFLKDGEQGTHGSPWTARIQAVDTGGFTIPFQQRLTVPRPLRFSGTPESPGNWQEGSSGLNAANRQLILRPFVTKHGIPLEALPETDQYRITVNWDVRYGPGAWDRGECGPNAEMQAVAGQSFLRLATTDGNLTQDEGLRHTHTWGPFTAAGSVNYAHPSVEVRWATNPGVSLSLAQLRFATVVRAQIDVFRGAEGNERIATIFSYWPVDLLFLGNSTGLDSNLLHTNWPQFVDYDAAGYNPQFQPGDPLKLLYGPNRFNEDPPVPETAPARLATLAARGSRSPLATINARPEDRRWTYEPVPHFLAAEWIYDSIRSELDTPARTGGFENWGTAVFIRPQVFRLITHGNSDINAWNGQHISMMDGVILAPTVGAGWKEPYTNTFTGVLMGINTAKRKQNHGVFTNFGTNAIASRSGRQFMVGLFGYQNGISSFGIMENGMAYFGRADRGRIIIDGINAQIYGGATTRPGIDGAISSRRGMEMHNRMRLSFIDFHAPGNMDSGGAWGQGLLNQTEGPSIDGCSDISIGTLPLGIPREFVLMFTSTPLSQVLALPSTPSTGIVSSPYNFSSTRGFGSGVGYSTPAIEIGQYDGDGNQHLRQNLTLADISAFENDSRFQSLSVLQVPGRRRFLVTYDGTMFAMNAFFQGTIIGSNIIGGQFLTEDGSAGITSEGNLIIGYGPRPVMRQIRSVGTTPNVDPQGYANRWSDRMPQVEFFAAEMRLPTSQSFMGNSYEIRDEFTRARNSLGLAQPTNRWANFFVSRQGVVIAREIHILGGSFNIGNFFIVGEDPPALPGTVLGGRIPPTTPNAHHQSPPGTQPNWRLSSGDVVSFGTMYLVGGPPNITARAGADTAGLTQTNPNQGNVLPTIGRPPNALEAWGDVYLRGKLTNLGPVFLGISAERSAGISGAPGVLPPTTIPGPMNTPFSIMPTIEFEGTPPWAAPDLPIRMGMWPLFFRLGTATLAAGVNDAWVCLAANPHSIFGGTFENTNGFIPAFNLRQVVEEGGLNPDPDRGPIVMPAAGGIGSNAWMAHPETSVSRHVVWRVDQLGLWTDALLFTRASWTGNLGDNQRYSMEDQALAYLGWAEAPFAVNIWDAIFGPRTRMFSIRNASVRAPHMVLETPLMMRLIAGNTAVLKGTVGGGSWVDSISGAIVQDTYAPGGNRRATTIVHGERDAFCATAGTVMLTGKRSGRTGLHAAPGDIDAFISLNQIGWPSAGSEEVPHNVRDERGSILASIPTRDNEQSNGYIWSKARTILFDAYSRNQAVGEHVPQNNYGMNAQFRLNRTGSGNPQQYAAIGTRVPFTSAVTHTPNIGTSGVLLGHAHLRGGYGVNIIGATFVQLGTGSLGYGSGSSPGPGSGRRIIMVPEGIYIGFNGDNGLALQSNRFEIHGYAHNQQFRIFARFG